jgi:NADH:ubiquinone oxidoreductase subunit 5 (subunit L)/multisubunit Na+/H+ antiporter MnhA subunit
MPLLPGASALALLLFGRRLSRRWVAWQASGSVFFSLALSVAAFAHLLAAGDGAPVLSKTLLPWIACGAFSSSFAFAFDELAAIMTLVVTGVGLLI